MAREAFRPAAAFRMAAKDRTPLPDYNWLPQSFTIPALLEDLEEAMQGGMYFTECSAFLFGIDHAKDDITPPMGLLHMPVLYSPVHAYTIAEEISIFNGQRRRIVSPVFSFTNQSPTYALGAPLTREMIHDIAMMDFQIALDIRLRADNKSETALNDMALMMVRNTERAMDGRKLAFARFTPLGLDPRKAPAAKKRVEDALSAQGVRVLDPETIRRPGVVHARADDGVYDIHPSILCNSRIYQHVVITAPAEWYADRAAWPYDRLLGLPEVMKHEEAFSKSMAARSTPLLGQPGTVEAVEKPSPLESYGPAPLGWKTPQPR